MAGPNAPGKFPGPYINSVAKDESMMEYIDTEKMGIGARASGLPDKGALKPEGMSIEHVGGSAGKK